MRWFILALVLVGCGGKRFDIPSSSMLPTIEVGDKIATRAFEGVVQRGDVVVYVGRASTSPLYEGGPDKFFEGKDRVARVMALPGERVRIEGEIVIVGGVPLTTTVEAERQCEVYGMDFDRTPAGTCPCTVRREAGGGRAWLVQNFATTCGGGGTPDWPLAYRPPGTTRYLGAQAVNPDWPDVVVPQGHVLLLGDNRYRSEDSRFMGFTAIEDIHWIATEVVGNDAAPERAGLPL